MKAVTFSEPGGPEVLEVRGVPDPEPGPGQLLVRVFAAGINRADLLQRRGLYPPPAGESEILGLEYAGEVARVGEGVEGWSVSDPAFGIVGGGGCAELVAVDARLAVPIPETLSFDAAAALPEAFMTAWESLVTLGGLQERESLLILAGASGVGSAAIQVARALGARVLASASSEEKRTRCRELGADVTIDYRTEDVSEVARRATDGRGVDLLLDLVGASQWERSLRSLREGGRLVLIGLLGGSRVEADLGVLLARRLRILSDRLRAKRLEERIEITDRFRRRVLPLLEAGRVRPVLDRVYPLDEVREAHERMEQNRNTGKIVLRL